MVCFHPSYSRCFVTNYLLGINLNLPLTRIKTSTSDTRSIEDVAKPIIEEDLTQPLPVQEQEDLVQALDDVVTEPTHEGDADQATIDDDEDDQLPLSQPARPSSQLSTSESQTYAIPTTRTYLVPRVEVPGRETMSSPGFTQSHNARQSREGYPSSVFPDTPSSAAFERHSESEKPSEDDAPPTTSAVVRHSVASSSSLNNVAAMTPDTRLVSPDLKDYDYTEWETDFQTDREGLTDYEGPARSPSRSRKKRDRESGGKSSGWREKLKQPFGGRRSRSNSFARPQGGNATTPNRESGASVKTDQSGPTAGVKSSSPASGAAQALSSSASLLSLVASAVPPPREGLSPIPPISQAGMGRYTNPKLMPLPGIVRLEEERRERTRKLSTSGEVPLGIPSGTVPNTRVNSPEPGGARLVRQSSDSRLWSRSRASTDDRGTPGDETEYEESNWNGGRSTPGYIDLGPMPPRSPTPYGRSPTPTSGSKGGLPQSKEAALKWIAKRREGKGGPETNGAVSDSNTIRPGIKKKNTLNELFASFRTNDSETEKEDRATPRPGGKRRVQEQLRKWAGSPIETDSGNPLSYSLSSASSKSERPERPSLEEPESSRHRSNGHASAASISSSISGPISDTASPTMLTFPVTPPLNLIRSPSSPSPSSPAPRAHFTGIPIKSALHKPISSPSPPAILHQFHELVTPLLTDNERLGAPPRQFLMSSPVRQIISPNEVKNRFILLFSDILVVGKFLTDDADEPTLDRKLVVRTIIELRKASFRAHEDQSHAEFMRLNCVRDLIIEFPTGPEEAMAHCIERGKLVRDTPTIASLLFKITGLDATTLTRYLGRRANRTVFRVYLDRFGFNGMRIDMSLRLFLLCIRLPEDNVTLEYLLATFASRWFDANKGVVTFDRDLTLRLVLAMMQLNDNLHQISPGGGRPSSPSSRGIMSRDFIDAFRAVDQLALVSDDLLHKLYISIRNERLVQGLDSHERDRDTLDIFIDDIPHSLIARVPSDSVTIRIPKPDPYFRIHLHGRELFFDPPTLEFANSNEATFVVIGSTLGKREVVFVRSGGSAARYSGLPISQVVNVERPFMPNTFSISFPVFDSTHDRSSATNTSRIRTYRFNVLGDDHAKWTDNLKRLIAAYKKGDTVVDQAGDPTVLSQRQMQRAAESVAIQALRSSLIADEATEDEDEDKTLSLRRPAPSDSKPRRPEPIKGTDLIAACRQNSMIPSVLLHLQTKVLPNGGQPPAPHGSGLFQGDLVGSNAGKFQVPSRSASRLGNRF